MTTIEKAKQLALTLMEPEQNIWPVIEILVEMANWQKKQILKALLDMEEDSVEVERKYGEGGRELYLKMLGILRTFEED